MLDMAIKGGTVVTEAGATPADIGIESDKIAFVARAGALPEARQEINAEGMLVLPGAIDIHFHVRAPAHPERGTFATETRAAAAGGVTTVLEMPISTPGCARRDILEDRKALGLADAYVNFGLYGAPGLLDRNEILGMADAGACGFKVFTHATPAGREDEFLGLCLPEEQDIHQALELIKETGLMTSFHAENERLIQLFEGRMRATGRKDPAAFVESRPPVIEAMAISQLAVLCEAVDTHVHIAHVSGKWPLRVLQEAQSRGLPMTGETCPHYLSFTAADVDKHGPFAKIKPPLRTEADQQALWNGLIDGSLLAITTDHSPYTLEEKERGLDDIWHSAIGAPGVEALVPFVMTQALNERITLEQALRYISSQPARLFKLYPQKGTLQPGADADLILYDPREAGAIDSTQWLTKAKVIERLYNGQPRQGKVVTTIVNGVVVFDRGQIVAEAKAGRFVRPLRH
jgi:allantoinase